MTGRADSPPERLRNALVRRVDWRFVYEGEEEPRVLDLASGAFADAFRSLGHDVAGARDAADVVILGDLSASAVTRAHDHLRRGGLLCVNVAVPAPGGRRRLRRRLERAGFADVRFLWPWPPPRRRTPALWLPVGSERALRAFLASRPAASSRQAFLRRAWWWAARTGMVWPLWVTARRLGGPGSEESAHDELGALLPRAPYWALLTGGHRPINKVVGIPLPGDGELPQVIVKFARVPEAEAGLAREAESLRRLDADHGGVGGVPRVLGVGRRAGSLAVAETVVSGTALTQFLSRRTFEPIARRVGQWLLGLVSDPGPAPGWGPRLVADPLARFERQFSRALSNERLERIAIALAELPPLPRTHEHRDCAPWNVLLGGDGHPGLVDWESSEPDGLPLLDLVYFLANCAFILEGALESGRTRAAYAALLDARTDLGAVAAGCLDQHCAELGIDAETASRLRLLCWIVHSASEYAHLRMAGSAEPSVGALRGSVFLGLIEEEVSRLV